MAVAKGKKRRCQEEEQQGNIQRRNNNKVRISDACRYHRPLFDLFRYSQFDTQ